LRNIKRVNSGKIVATTKDQNNNAVEIQVGNNELSNNNPTKILFSNVKLGKKSKPPISPAATDSKAFHKKLEILLHNIINLPVKTCIKHSIPLKLYKIQELKALLKKI
jgi:hypothetical protein